MSYETLNKALGVIVRLEAELAEAREAFGHSESERCELRAALRDTIEALGGVAAPGVSIQFLKLAPQEAAAVKKKLAEAREDSERLEWLLKDHGFRISYHFANRRQIDAARKGKP